MRSHAPCRRDVSKFRSASSSQAPSSPGNSDPAVIPMNLSSRTTSRRSLTGRSIAERYVLFLISSFALMYDSMSSRLVTVVAACCGIIRSFSMDINSPIEK